MAGVADKNALKAGIFILVSLGIAVATFLAIRSVGAGNRQEWTVVFDLSDDVGGIAEGSEVRIGGVPTGQVQSVDPTDDYNRIEVVVTLPTDLPLREGAVIQVQSTVTGVAWLNVNALGGGDPLSANDPIRGQAGTISDLVTAINKFVPQVAGLVNDTRDTTVPKLNSVLTESEATIRSIRETTDVVNEQIQPSVDRYNTLADAAVSAATSVKDAADNAGRVAGNLADVIGNEGPDSDLGQTIANLRTASEKMPGLLDETQELVTTANETVTKLQTTVDDTATRLNSVLEDVDVVASDVRGIIGGNKAKLNQIVRRLQGTAGTLELAAQEIRRSPWRLLYQPDGKTRQNLDLYDAARRFAEGAGALEDASIALQDAADDPTTTPEQMQALLDDVRAKFDEFEQIEQGLYERLQ